MYRHRLLLTGMIVALLSACSHKEPGTGDASCADKKTEAELQQLHADTLPHQQEPAPAMKAPEGYITVSAYKNPKDEPAGGFGYDLMSDGKSMIHQPHIPAVPGLKGFASKEDAEKAGNLMKMKIEKGIMPPTVSIEELDSMKIKY
ncbi:MAG: DUF4907 domain-containing protein [Bacteroidia bacterium]